MSEPALPVDNNETTYGLSQGVFGMSSPMSPGGVVARTGRNGRGQARE